MGVTLAMDLMVFKRSVKVRVWFSRKVHFVAHCSSGMLPPLRVAVVLGDLWSGRVDTSVPAGGWDESLPRDSPATVSPQTIQKKLPIYKRKIYRSSRCKWEQKKTQVTSKVSYSSKTTWPRGTRGSGHMTQRDTGKTRITIILKIMVFKVVVVVNDIRQGNAHRTIWYRYCPRLKLVWPIPCLARTISHGLILWQDGGHGG